ncbi:hypothetical protein Tco_0776406, partial [Tanacetum coccineum]
VEMIVDLMIVDLLDVEDVVIVRVLLSPLLLHFCLNSNTRKLRSGGLGESNHMIAILVRESREMEDGLVILDGKWMKDTNDSTMPNDSTPLWKP